MPARVNGIGTAYHGSSNRQGYDGVCEHCHKSTRLQNYETRLWFTVLFLPVIPLERKQILGYCPHCTWHRAMPMAQWEHLRDDAIGRCTAKWDENREDADAALELLSALVGFQKRSEADRLAHLLTEQFATVARVQFQVGAWFEKSGHAAEAETCFARAFELEPANLVYKRAVAIGHIEQGRLSAARTLLADFEPPSPAFEPGLFFLLAKACQEVDQHQDALALFRMLVERAPAFAADKTFRAAVRNSERTLGVETSIVRSDPFYKSKSFLWTAAAVLVVIGVAGWNRHIRTHRTLHIVNGLKVPISVALDGGAAVDLRPNGRNTVTVAEGDHKAAVVAPAGFAPNLDFTVAADWIDRFVRSPVFVLDPTHSAAVAWESTTYSKLPLPGGAGGKFKLHAGQTLTTYPDVDYIFQEFPAQLTVKNQHGDVTKTRITIVNAEPFAILSRLAQTGDGQTLAYAESHLRGDPQDKLTLAVYSAVAAQQGQLDRCREFLAGGLNERPVRVEWHRAYQHVCEAQKRDEELIKQYDGYLAADPDGSMLLYLRGRIEPDEARSVDFYERARVADPQNPYPWFALGYRQLAAGDFTPGRDALEKAWGLNPGNPLMQPYVTDARFAVRDFDALEREFKEPPSPTRSQFGMHQLELERLVAAGRNEQADAAHAEFVRKVSQPPGDAMHLAQQSQLYLNYLEGKFAEMLAVAQKLPDPELATSSQFQAQIELGQLDKLPATKVTGRHGSYETDLVLHLAWSRQGNAAEASAALDRAIASLAAGRKEERRVAELLKLGADVPAGAAENLVVESSSKAVVLTTLALVCREQKSTLLDLAEKLNYRLAFPHHYLRRTIAELRKE